MARLVPRPINQAAQFIGLLFTPPYYYILFYLQVMGSCASNQKKGVGQVKTKQRKRIRRRETLNTSSIANKIFEQKSQETEMSSQQSLDEEWLDPQQTVEINGEDIFKHFIIQTVLGHACYKAKWKHVGISVYLVKLQGSSDIRKTMHQLRVIKHFNKFDFIEMYRGDDCLWLVYDYVPDDLLSYLIGQQELVEQNIKYMVRQIVQALIRINYLQQPQLDLHPSRIRIRQQSVLLQYSRNSLCPSRFMAPEAQLQPDSQADVFSIGGITHLMLTGKLPSQKYDNNDDIYLDTTRFKCLSYSCQDLLKSMLKKNKMNRLQLKEILQHKWFHKEHNNKLPGAVKAGCEQYQRVSRVKTMIRAMTDQLSIYNRRHSLFLSICQSLDQQETGCLTTRQLIQVSIKVFRADVTSLQENKEHDYTKLISQITKTLHHQSAQECLQLVHPDTHISHDLYLMVLDMLPEGMPKIEQKDKVDLGGLLSQML